MVKEVPNEDKTLLLENIVEVESTMDKVKNFSKKVVEDYKNMPNKEGGFISTGATTDLIKEAKKYKSAEEFVNSQMTGTNFAGGGGYMKNYTKTKVGSGIKMPDFIDMPDSLEFNTIKLPSRIQKNLEIAKGTISQPASYTQGDNVYLFANKKLDINKLSPSEINTIANNKYSINISQDGGKTWYKITQSNQSQLEQIWKEAQQTGGFISTGATTDLIKEAKKYKSAEEFVKAQGGIGDSIGQAIKKKVELDSITDELSKKANSFASKGGLVEDTKNLEYLKIKSELNKKMSELKAFNNSPLGKLVQQEVNKQKDFNLRKKLRTGNFQTKSQLEQIWKEAQQTGGFISTGATTDLIKEAKKYKSAEDFIKAQETKSPSYAVGGGSGHTAPLRDVENAPAFDLTQLYPNDIYSDKASRLYGSGFPEADRKAISILQNIKGNPDAEIIIYRAVPKGKGIKDFNKGDWVTLTKEYAKDHGESNLSGKYDILSKKIKADELFTDANSIQEFGYDPRSLAKSQLEQIWKEAQKTGGSTKINPLNAIAGGTAIVAGANAIRNKKSK